MLKHASALRTALGAVLPLTLFGSTWGSGGPLAERNAHYTHGKIAYHLDYPERKHANGSTDKAVTQEGVLVFASDGRYLHRLKKAGNLPPNVLSVTMVKGRGWSYMEEARSKETRVSFEDEAAFPRDDDSLHYVTEHPCAPLGFGLEDFSLASVSPAPNGGVEYRSPKGRLVLDAQGAPVLQEWTSGSRLIFRWRYEGSIKASPAILVPRQATYDSPAFNVARGQTYDFKSVDLHTEPHEEDLVTPWFRTGVTVIDRRVDPVATWSYDKLRKANGGSATITPDKLLQLSKGLSQFFHNEEARKRAAASPKSTSSTSLYLYVLAPLAVGAAYLASRRAKRNV